MAAKSGARLSWGGLDKAMLGAARALDERGRKALLNDVGEALISSTIQRFQDGKGPDGKEWRTPARGGKALQDKGQLQGSIAKAVTSSAVMVGSNLEYARIRQKGGTIKPKKGKYLKFPGKDGKDVFVKEVKVEATPYLGISDEDKEEIAAILSDHLKNGFLGT